MSAPIVSPADCGCVSTASDCSPQQIPGPQGNPGVDGTNGTDGENAFTTTTASFVQPAVSSTVNIEVVNSDWATVGQPVFVTTGGSYLVTTVPDSSHVTIQNLGYSGNAAPAAVIASASVVTPSGLKGDAGTSSSGDMLRANNLSDVISVATSRSNLGLGTLATLNTVNNGQWSGTALAVGNGGTGATTAATARTNLSAQTQDAILDALAALNTLNNDMLYFTGADAPALLHTTTSYGRAFLTDANSYATRLRLGHTLPRYGLLAPVIVVDLNSGTTDNAISVESSRYRVDKITLEGASINITTATAGVFTAPAAGGTTLAADQSLASLTAATKFHDLTLQAVAGTDVVTTSVIYLRVNTPQGAAATANCWLFGWIYE